MHLTEAVSLTPEDYHLATLSDSQEVVHLLKYHNWLHVNAGHADLHHSDSDI